MHRVRKRRQSSLSMSGNVLKQLVKLEQNPDYGDPLGNKAGINLDGYFETFA